LLYFISYSKIKREGKRNERNKRTEDCLILMAGIDAVICAYICPFSFLLSPDGWRRYEFVLMPVRQICQKENEQVQ